MDRTILHCDCNNYFASVECIFRPELRDVPMAVCGDPEGRKGIVVAKNELAKKYGVNTTDTVWQAKKKCPHITLVQPHGDLYREYSEKVNAIYQQYTDQVESFSIDESWLDVTGSLHLFGSGKEIADTLRRRVWEELALTISVGVSFNKQFAKMGSDYKKPNATTVISRENFREILYPLPVEAMMYIGKTAGATLRKYHIETIGDIAASTRERIAGLLGKGGEGVWDLAHGIEDSPVRRPWEGDMPKSVGNSLTFARNLVGLEDMQAGLLMLCESVGARLRSHGLFGQTVAIQIKNPKLEVISRQMPLPGPTRSTRVLYENALALLQRSWNVNDPVRLLSVTATNLCDYASGGYQVSLFPEEALRQDKVDKLEGTIDALRRRFGTGALETGRVMATDIIHKRHEDPLEKTPDE